MIASSLLKRLGGYINGDWIDTQPARGLSVINPATMETLAQVPDMAAAETNAAVEAAAMALTRASSIEQRRSCLMSIHDALLRSKAELAQIITQEQGKPLPESTVEVEYAAGFFKYFSSILDQLSPRKLPDRIRGAAWTIHHRPAGVVALITPWNFPLAMLAKKLAPALAAGCAVVVKPADLTPLTTIALWHLLDELKLPAGVANLVIGKAAPIGAVLCSHPAVRLISFTGSTEVGRFLIAQTAPYVKRLALELGGNAPFIVMDDADLPLAVDALMANKFRCAGQTCVCANRVLVQRGVADEFSRLIAARVQKLRVGNGMDQGIEIGPLINAAGVTKVRRHVDDALARGATKIAETPTDSSITSQGTFYAPTVLNGIARESQMLAEETFGPVVAISDFADETEALVQANSTIYGLAAYLFTRDQARIARMTDKLQFGHVGLNSATGPTPEAPFGGMKQSGFGREGGIEGLIEFTEVQTVVQS